MDSRERASFLRKLGMTAHRASILLRALEHPQHDYKGVYADRNETVGWLVENGYFSWQPYLEEVEINRNQKLLYEKANEAKSLLPFYWADAAELLRECQQLKSANDHKCLRLTNKGVEMARKLFEAEHREIKNEAC